MARCSWKFLNAHRSLAPFCHRQWGERARDRRTGKRKGGERLFSRRFPGRNGWSMQSGVTEGKGSRGWKGGLVMTRNLFVALFLSFCLFLSVELETLRYRVTQRPTLSSDVPKCSPPAKAEEKAEEKDIKKKEKGRDFLRRSWVCITTLYTDRPLLRQTIIYAAALETNYPQPRVRKLSQPRSRAPPTKHVQKGGEKWGSTLDLLHWRLAVDWNAVSHISTKRQ